MDKQMATVRAEEKRVYRTEMQKNMEADLVRIRERVSVELGKMNEALKRGDEISEKLPGSHLDLIKLADRSYYSLAMALNRFSSDIDEVERHFLKMHS